jgi:hypothetical protein
MKIANPIYDAAFKYLMEDMDIAKGLLSLILQEDIISLEMKPQELITTSTIGFRIFRIDFKAIIKTKKGKSKTILIEIQKAKKESDFEILRFRRYLGINYQMQEDIISDSGTQQKASLPITTVYFLGFNLKHILTPVAVAKRQYINLLTGRKLKTGTQEVFFEQLSHDMFAIQIRRLKMEIQTEIEKMLDVFSTKKYRTTDKKVLEYTGDTSDPRVARMVNRLNLAMFDPDVQRKMWAEEELEMELEAINKRIENIQLEKEEERKAKEEERKAKEIAEARITILEQQIALLLEKLKSSEQAD